MKGFVENVIRNCGECFYFNSGLPLEEKQHKAVCGATRANERAYRDADQESCIYAKKTTLDRLLWPLLDGDTIKTDHCVVCGKRGDLNQHHVVRRGAGEVFGLHGKKETKPTITLCGFGNASGCHGKAHRGELHFKWSGCWEYIETEAMPYSEALELEGWRLCE